MGPRRARPSFPGAGRRAGARCQAPANRLRASVLHVDHPRGTGRVRGVMCINCNSGLGQLRDDPEAVDRAADHLEGNVWKPTLVAPGVCRPPS
ncbi:endonuclease domain-containing protein [Streptomyces sp. CB01373]|uniref:endonuclease domain-containing protein n=1 Tax=Streptomyces sp. CB01373 TaxID=2020325 RepID=UPI000C26EC53|nr:endonuclease domain-containing protein [Streptomyces sp. CB01373]PJM96258.1 hypothetical protein CG719_07560 [Streptomyces sp. CB01373]